MLATVRAVPTRGVLRLDWLVGRSGPLLDTPGRVALSSCPGRPDLGNTLRDDLDRLVSQGIRVVVSLVGDREMEFYGAFGLRAAVREAGLHSIHLPLVDTQPPEDLFSARTVCTELLGRLGEGEHVLIHCIGGWGRSGTLAASLLTHQGLDAATAIRLVRQARNPRCVESRAQEDFVHAYAAAQGHYERYYLPVRRSGLPGLLIGVPAARRLRPELAPSHRRLTAAELPELLRSIESLPPNDLLLLSGELPRHSADEDAADHEESGSPAARSATGGYPVDRAFTLQDRTWHPVPLAGIAQ